MATLSVLDRSDLFAASRTMTFDALIKVDRRDCLLSSAAKAYASTVFTVLEPVWDGSSAWANEMLLSRLRWQFYTSTVIAGYSLQSVLSTMSISASSQGESHLPGYLQPFRKDQATTDAVVLGCTLNKVADLIGIRSADRTPPGEMEGMLPFLKAVGESGVNEIVSICHSVGPSASKGYVDEASELSEDLLRGWTTSFNMRHMLMSEEVIGLFMLGAASTFYDPELFVLSAMTPGIIRRLLDSPE